MRYVFSSICSIPLKNTHTHTRLFSDELCPDPGSFWYIQKNQWKTDECPDDLKHCASTFQGVSEKNPVKLVAKTMAFFKDTNVVTWWVEKKVLAYCGSTYYVSFMEDDYDRHYKIKISNTTISRARCCGVRITSGYDGAKDC